jgi:ArsR family transcriptional regulator
MSYPRSKEFEESQTEIADFARVLSHPARLAILEVLARRTECICGDLVDELPLAQATVSQHLKVLKDAGLISGEISGPRTCYCVNWEIFERVETIMKAWFDKTKQSASCC